MHPADFPWLPEPQPALDTARSLFVRWLGTAGYELTCDGTTLLIDPYLSRVSLGDFLFRRLTPDEALIRANIGKADAIVVGHTHFDHALDVPLIARLTGARVYGSTSTVRLLRASGIPEAQVVECRGGEVFEVGPFRVELVPSEHSHFAAGRVPFPGDIPSSCEVPMRGHQYRCGQVFGTSIAVGGRRLYHVGSANLVDDAIRDRDIDAVLLCIAARRSTERFIPRILGKLRPRWVVPTHYDNFFRPLRSSLQLLPRIAFGRFVEEVTGFDRDTTVVTLDLDGSVRLPLSG
jgi:L-ascorbate metabolism protein UlaG (beta-lactamase superfamily)